MSKRPVGARRCIVCRGFFDKKVMLRLCHDREGLVIIDKDGTAGGKGSYICKSSSCIKKAQKKRIPDRIFKRSLDRDFYDGLTGVLDNEG